MSYNGDNLHLKVPSAPGGSQIWVYSSADAHGDVDAANWFSDGVTRGMRAEDIVFVIDTATPTLTMHTVLSVSGAAATISPSGQ